MSFDLYRQEGEERRSVRVRADTVSFVVDTQDEGPATEALWGDRDYEFWISVKREAWGALLIALAREFLANDPDATDRLRDICRRHGVAHEWGSWA